MPKTLVICLKSLIPRFIIAKNIGKKTLPTTCKFKKHSPIEVGQCSIACLNRQGPKIFFLNKRFINSIDGLDPNIAWDAIKEERDYYLNYTFDYDKTCTFLIPNDDIEENNWYVMYLLNISASEEQKNLTEDDINSGAEMFLYLNSCPQTETKEDIETIFERVFKKYLFEPTNSGIVLYTLNAKRRLSNDKRIIASKILEKISTVFNLSLVPLQKDFLNLNEEFGISKFCMPSIGVPLEAN